MDKSKSHIGWFILFPAAAMWLGWGIRGQIGHSTGAMIPGAFVGLTLCLLLSSKEFSRGLVVALTAVGFGFGADMTTMQSAGMVMGTIRPHAGSLMLGYSGLAIKGALWALFGGAGLGIAFAASRYRRKDIVLAVAFMVASFWVGWALIDRPKLLYLSVDRGEIWGGLLFGAIALLLALTVRGRTRIPLVMALCATVAGGIGYPIAVTLASVGMHSSYVGRWYDWWKVAETTFGTFMGAGLGIGAYILKGRLPDSEKPVELATSKRFSGWGVIFGVVLAALCTALYQTVAPWIILGSFLLCVAYYSDKVAWHIGVTLTFFATAANTVTYWVHEQRIGNAVILWVLVVLATLVVSWRVTTWWGKTTQTALRSAFVFTMWAILIVEYLKMLVNRAVVSPPALAVAAAGGRWAYTVDVWGHQLVTNVFFTVAAVVLTWMAYRAKRFDESPQGAKFTRTSQALT